jgi:hypothetical protein
VHKIVSQTRIDSLGVIFRLQLLIIHADHLFAAARIFAKTIVSDAVKPCGKPRFAAEAADILVSSNESFLREIISQGNVCTRELSEQTAHAGLMSTHELAERVLIITSENSRDKVGIG